jgi:hypothetical protein
VSTNHHDTVGELSIELEAKLLVRLVDEWESINATFFWHALRRPVFQLSDARERLGQWNAELRSLEISRSLVLERPWVEVVEVLKREVGHQFVDECLRAEGIDREPAFQRVCERLGIDVQSRGPEAPAADDPASRTLDRIRKLLALAQSPNQHEAELAAMTARRLMLRLNLEVDRTPRPVERRRYGFRHLGRPAGRIFEHDRRLASILGKYFFVQSLWIPVYRPREGKRGTVLEICGLEANLLMAEHVHAFLSATVTRLWSEYARGSGQGVSRDRQAFLAGAMRGFDAKLEAQGRQLEEQGLVWAPPAELRSYFQRRYPRIQTVHRSGARRNDAYAEGERAGREIVLSQPVATGPSGEAPKALRGAKE